MIGASLGSPVALSLSATLAWSPVAHAAAADQPYVSAERRCRAPLDALRRDDHYYVVCTDDDNVPLIEELDASLAPLRSAVVAVQWPETLAVFDGDLVVAGHDGAPPVTTAAIVRLDHRSLDPLARATVAAASFRDVVRVGSDIVAVGIGGQTSEEDGDILLARFDAQLASVDVQMLGGAGQDLARAALVEETRLVLAVQSQGGVLGAPLERDDIDAWLVEVPRQAGALDVERAALVARADGPGFDVLKDVERQGDTLIAVGATQPTKPISLSSWPRGPALQGLVLVVAPREVRVERRPSVSSYWDVIGRSATGHKAGHGGAQEASLSPWRGGAPFVRCALRGAPVFAAVARGHRTWLLGAFETGACPAERNVRAASSPSVDR